MPDEWSYGANAQVPLFLDDVIDGADQGMIALPTSSVNSIGRRRGL